MKKLISLLCILAITIGVLTTGIVSVSADTPATVIDVKTGDKVSYALTLTDVSEKVVGCDFSVYYDPDAFRLESIADFNDNTNDENWSATINPDLSGEVRGNWSILRGIDFSQKRNIVTLNLTAKKDISTHITYFIRYLYDSSAFSSSDRPQITRYTFTCSVTKNGAAVLTDAAPELEVNKEQITGTFKNSKTGKSADASASLTGESFKPKNTEPTRPAATTAPTVAPPAPPATVAPTTPGSGGNNGSASSSSTLAAPAVKSLANKYGYVYVTFNKSKGAAKYRIFRKTGSGKWTILADTAALTFKDKKAVSGKKYTYGVRCLSKDRKKYTSALGKTKAITYIAAPVLISAKKSGKAVKFTWKKSAGAVKYRVFRKIGKGKWTKLGDTKKLYILDKKVKKKVKYTYTVRCITNDGKKFVSDFNTVGKAITYK